MGVLDEHASAFGLDMTLFFNLWSRFAQKCRTVHNTSCSTENRHKMA